MIDLKIYQCWSDPDCETLECQFVAANYYEATEILKKEYGINIGEDGYTEYLEELYIVGYKIEVIKEE